MLQTGFAPLSSFTKDLLPSGLSCKMHVQRFGAAYRSVLHAGGLHCDDMLVSRHSKDMRLSPASTPADHQQHTQQQHRHQHVSPVPSYMSQDSDALAECPLVFELDFEDDVPMDLESTPDPVSKASSPRRPFSAPQQSVPDITPASASMTADRLHYDTQNQMTQQPSAGDNAPMLIPQSGSSRAALPYCSFRSAASGAALLVPEAVPAVADAHQRFFNQTTSCQPAAVAEDSSNKASQHSTWQAGQENSAASDDGSMQCSMVFHEDAELLAASPERLWEAGIAISTSQPDSVAAAETRQKKAVSGDANNVSSHTEAVESMQQLTMSEQAAEQQLPGDIRNNQYVAVQPRQPGSQLSDKGMLCSPDIACTMVFRDPEEEDAKAEGACEMCWDDEQGQGQADPNLPHEKTGALAARNIVVAHQILEVHACGELLS